MYDFLDWFWQVLKRGATSEMDFSVSRGQSFPMSNLLPRMNSGYLTLSPTMSSTVVWLPTRQGWVWIAE